MTTYGEHSATDGLLQKDPGTFAGSAEASEGAGAARTVMAVARSPGRTIHRPVKPFSVRPSTTGPGTRRRASKVPVSGSGVTIASSKPSHRRVSGNHTL